MASTGTPLFGPVEDGRRARAVRSRDAVVDAILDLIGEDGTMPSAATIAEHAGVSVRSVFRYFDDLESLYVAAVDRHVERVEHLFAPPSSAGSLDRRVQALVSSRVKLFETIAPVRRAAERLRGRSPVIGARLAEGQQVFAAQVAKQFEPELTPMPVGERRELAIALDVATSWRTWDTMHTDLGCPKSVTEAVMRRTVRALLANR